MCTHAHKDTDTDTDTDTHKHMKDTATPASQQYSGEGRSKRYPKDCVCDMTHLYVKWLIHV